MFHILSLNAISRIHARRSYLLRAIQLYPPPRRQAEFMNGKVSVPLYTSPCMFRYRYRPRTKVRGRESFPSPSYPPEDDIIATMVMVFTDSRSKTRIKSKNFPIIFK